jgi:hypothetical protein
MRWVACVCIVIALGSCKEELYFIPGTGTLPNCNEAPITDLDGTCWFDNGTVTIQTAGCQEAMPNDMFTVCGLDWSFTQTGNDVTIIVDGEYRIEGRLCGDQLYLRGGWWLPVVDEDVNSCTYEDDSAEEVGIMAEGNVLTVAENQMTGTLVVQGGCSADYDVVFQPGTGCFF